MSGFGERLRRERELRGIKLEEISESTKISVRYLRALEEEDLEKLPGGIFSKGFVRAYAKYLGIDEEQALADFVGVVGEPQTELPNPPPPPEKPQVDTHYSRWWIVAAIVALIAVAVYFNRGRLMKGAESGESPRPMPAVTQPPQAAAGQAPAQGPADSTSTNPSGTPASTPSQTTTPPAQTPTAAGKPQPAANPNLEAKADGRVVVDLHTRDQAWVQWVVDGGSTQEATLPANSQKRISGNQQVTVKVGNAGAVELTYNGKTLSPMGKDKQVKSMTFTAEGIQQ